MQKKGADPTSVQSREIRINYRIRAPQVRVIGAKGEQLGVMTSEEAIRRAQEGGLDLVEVAGAAAPPVCRIMDFSKYKYEQSKREREAKKHQRVIHIKEIRMKPHIEEHDYQVKRRACEKFLSRGDKAKVTVVFRGREMSHQEMGRQLLTRLTSDLNSVADVEKTPFMEGRFMTMIFTVKPGLKVKIENKKNPEE